MSLHDSTNENPHRLFTRRALLQAGAAVAWVGGTVRPAAAQSSAYDTLKKMRIWDTHCHLDELPNLTPQERMALLLKYHSYTLEDPRFARLLEITGQHGLIVQLAMRMEDVRTHHPLVKVPDVDFTPLPDVLRQFPEQRIELLNAMRYMSMQQAGDLANAGQIYFEFSMLEHVGGIEMLIRSVALERVLFGSYFPFFYFESATLKMQESDLDGAAIKAFNVENARQLVTAKGNVAPTRQR